MLPRPSDFRSIKIPSLQTTVLRLRALQMPNHPIATTHIKCITTINSNKSTQMLDSITIYKNIKLTKHHQKYTKTNNYNLYNLTSSECLCPPCIRRDLPPPVSQLQVCVAKSRLCRKTRGKMRGKSTSGHETSHPTAVFAQL